MELGVSARCTFWNILIFEKVGRTLSYNITSFPIRQITSTIFLNFGKHELVTVPTEFTTEVQIIIM